MAVLVTAIHALLSQALAGRIADGAEIPVASANPRGPVVSLPLMTSLKAMLYNALRETSAAREDRWISSVRGACKSGFPLLRTPHFC